MEKSSIIILIDLIREKLYKAYLGVQTSIKLEVSFIAFGPF